MGGRITKLLGGLGAGLAIAVAGATGVTWLTNKSANVADAGVVQPAAQPSASASEQSTAPQPALQSLDGLTMDAVKPVEMAILTEYWVVNSGANVEEFPLEAKQLPDLSCMAKDYATNEEFRDCLGETPGCTPEQRDWLANNALLTNEKLFVMDGRLGVGGVTLTNTSKSEQAISFKDIRLNGEIRPYENAGFSIACSNYNDWAGGAAAGFANARDVVLPSDSGTAVFGNPNFYGEDLTRNIPAGMPAVFNLGPGETSGAQLYVTVPHPVGIISGGVIATVSAADGEKDIEVPLPLLSGDEAAFLTVPGPTLWVDGGTVCPDRISKTAYTTMRTTCSFDQLKAEAARG